MENYDDYDYNCLTVNSFSTNKTITNFTGSSGNIKITGIEPRDISFEVYYDFNAGGFLFSIIVKFDENRTKEYTPKAQFVTNRRDLTVIEAIEFIRKHDFFYDVEKDSIYAYDIYYYGGYCSNYNTSDQGFITNPLQTANNIIDGESKIW